MSAIVSSVRGKPYSSWTCAQRGWAMLDLPRVSYPVLRAPIDGYAYAALAIPRMDLPASWRDCWHTPWRVADGIRVLVVNALLLMSVLGHVPAFYASFVIVELAGLGGAFEVFNGTHYLVGGMTYSGARWSNGVVLDAPMGGFYPEFTLTFWFNTWTITLVVVDPLSGRDWTLAGGYTDPEGTYTGAEGTCRVKWAGTEWP